MKNCTMEGAAGLAALMVLAASVAAPLHADPSAATSGWFGMTDQPWVNYAGLSPVLSANFTNLSASQTNATDPANATAFATIRNYVGQTVAVESVAMDGVSPGQNTTVSFSLALPPDVYTVFLFVVSPSGTAISTETNCTVVA